MSRGSRPSTVRRIRDIWATRKTLALLVRRDIKVRYADSVLGYVWSVLDPLLMSMVYFVVFTMIFQRTVGADPYILFLICALLPWSWFSGGVTDTGKALRSESRLVRSTRLPREIWVLKAVFAKGAEYVFSLPVLAIFALAYGVAPRWEIVYMPLAMLLQIILLMGIGFVLAPLYILVRDTERVVKIAIRFLFYGSPIIYGLSDVIGTDMLPPWAQTLYQFNPMAGIISLYRATFFGGEIHWSAVGFGSAVSVLVLVSGWALFRRLEPSVLKEI